MDTWATVAERRRDLLTQLEQLTPEQWEAQSLCTDWRVRHVVAHITFPKTYPVARTVVAVARSGFNINNYVRDDALARGEGSTAEILAAYRAAIGHRSTPPGRKPENVLVDLLLHSQDIRRPLGLPWSNPVEAMLTALTTLHDDRNLGIPKRVAGLRLIAGDAGWSAGDGDEVRGPADSVLLAMGGRSAGLADLEGPGVETLAARC